MDGLKNPSAMDAIIAFGVGIIFVALVIGVIVMERRRKRAELELLAERELAVMLEEVRLTGWGRFSLVMLVLSWLGAGFGLATATTVFQQIAGGVSFIGGTLLAGIGFMAGRRRTYRIYRSEQRVPL